MSEKAARIIIVDDEQRMCESLFALLTGDGYRVDAFQHSLEAVEAIRNGRVDLVIADIKMPEIDGLEILQVVKEVDDGIPVILMTGYASLESAVEAVSKGAYDYLLKPVEFAHLELAVNRALEKRKSDLSRLQLLEELKLSNMILQRRVGELNALYEAGKSIGSTVNLRELLRQIIILAATVTDAQVGSIMLLDDERAFLTIEAAIGLSEEIIATTRLPIGESIAGYVAQEGKPIIVEDVEDNKRFKRMNKERYGSASLLCCPLRIKNKVIGVINLANKVDEQIFSKNDLRLLSTFASQAAVAVDDANQFEKNRRRLIEYEILHDVSSELPMIQTLHDFRSSLVKKLCRVFAIDYSIWFDWNESTQMLIPKGATGQTNFPLTDSGGIDLRKADRLRVTIGPLDLEEADLNDIRSLSKLIATHIAQKDDFPKPERAIMAIPIYRHEKLAHLFYLGANKDLGYSDDDIMLAKLVISQAALLFEKEQSLLNATRLLTMGNMISEISHDLRKPLTNIKGAVQIMGQRWPKKAEDSALFRSTEEEIHRMNELVRELVDFSNPNKYETELIDLRQVVARSGELMERDFEKRKVEFINTFDDKVNWEMMVNKNQILEVLLNLLINALDAMPDGGTLTVKGCIERPEHKKEDYLALKIIDTGVGISKEHLSRIFDRYYTTKETGTGLGLAVVERIISAHSGTLHVASEDGKGTVFTLYFPFIKL